MKYITIFVLFCFVLVFYTKRELFSSHNSDFVPESGIFNDTVNGLMSIFDSVKLTAKPESKPTFADSLGFVNKQSVDDDEQHQIILWIRRAIKLNFIRFNTFYKEKDIIYTEFYLDIDDPLYYILVSAELGLEENNNINVYSLNIKGLITQLSVKLNDTAPKPILYGSFIDNPEILNETTIRNELQLFEENKKEILLRNRVIR